MSDNEKNISIEEAEKEFENVINDENALRNTNISN